MGYALYQAQVGLKAPSEKPLHGFGSANILEIVEDYQTNTYRAVYTVKFAEIHLRSTFFPEEIQERWRYTKVRY